MPQIRDLYTYSVYDKFQLTAREKDRERVIASNGYTEEREIIHIASREESN